MSGLRDTACQTASRIEVGLQLCRDWSKPPLRYVECGKKISKNTYVTVYILIREKWFCIIPLVGRYGLDFFIWKTGKMFPLSYILFCYLMLISLQIFGNKRSRVAQSIHDKAGFKMTYGGIMVESCDVTPQEFPLVTRMTTPSYFWLQNEWLIIDSCVVLSKWSTFPQPMAESSIKWWIQRWKISLRRCSHPWERSSRCGRSWSQANGVVADS